MQLGWVDFSDNDRKKVLEVIHLLSEKGAVDELGFGIIRDGFADYFFPGTSTVQTRAKYYLLVPYILKEAVNKERPDRYLDTTEKSVAIEMFNKNMKDGLIGADSIAAGKWVVRAPSDIYWNGIKKLGIFKQDISINQYFQENEKIKRLKKNNSGNTSSKEEGEHDDDDAGNECNTSFWNLPTYKDDWKQNIDLSLTSREASFLRKRILGLKTKTGNQTLYSYILKNEIQLDEYESFESLAEAVKVSVNSEISEMLDLANKFNYLAMIAKCRYNILISDSLNDEAVQLWEEYRNKLDKIACVDIDKIFITLNLHKNLKLKLFLNKLQTLLKENNIEEIDKLIIAREKSLKGPERAKLLHPEKFDKEDYQDYFVGSAFLDYRMHSARRILNDIYEAENV